MDISGEKYCCSRKWKETINEKKFLKTKEEDKGKLKIDSNVYYKKALQKMVPKPINSETWLKYLNMEKAVTML